MAGTFDAEIIAILTKSDEILNCVVESLQSDNLNEICDLGPYFTNYLDKLHKSNEKLFLNVKIAMPTQLRTPT